LDDVNKHCLAEFRKHWECLDNNNQQLWQCRKFERPLNKCVFDNLVRDAEGACGAVETRFAIDMLITLQKLEKKIPGAPENEVPVHERKRQIYAHSITTQ
jgi:NADH dehydrogenase (ubiquinone) 1 alpha subcomplex subunit 8